MLPLFLLAQSSFSLVLLFVLLVGADLREFFLLFDLVETSLHVIALFLVTAVAVVVQPPIVALLELLALLTGLVAASMVAGIGQAAPR